jgi:hypothetical protein
MRLRTFVSDCGRALRRATAIPSLLVLAAGLAHGQQISAVAGSVHDAAAAGDAVRLERMLREGADLEQREQHGRTPLYAAAREGHADLVLSLLRAGALPNAGNYAGITPLHVAAERGHTQVVRILVANCSAVDARDLQQRTPLFLAASRGHRPVADLLLANGADARAKQKGGSTPLTVAVSFRQQSTADLLRERLARLGDAPLPAVVTANQPHGAAERVQFVQRTLQELGYPPGPADGQMTERTRRAIESFQREIGQVVSGKLSPCLLERISRELELRQARPAAPAAAGTAAGSS